LSRRAFTLVEVVVAIVVVGILTGIAVVAQQAVVRRSNESSAKTASETLARQVESLAKAKASRAGAESDFTIQDESVFWEIMNAGDLPKGYTVAIEGKTTPVLLQRADGVAVSTTKADLADAPKYFSIGKANAASCVKLDEKEWRVVETTRSSFGACDIVTVAPIPVGAPDRLWAAAMDLNQTGDEFEDPANSPLTPVSQAPPAPTAVTSDARDGAAMVSWTDASYGPNRASSYEVEVFDATGATPTGVTGATTRSSVAKNLSFTGLTNGTAYTFKVRAKNSVGDSAWSQLSSPVTPTETASAPMNITGEFSSTTGTLAWNPPANAASTGIASYIVSQGNSQACTTTTTSCTVSGLTPGAQFSFIVTAVGSAGPGTPSTPFAATTLGVPSNITTSVTGGTNVALSWTAPASDGNSAIADYVVSYSSNDGQTWTVFSTPTSTATSATVTSLSNGTFRFRVAAKNGVGMGSYSAPSDQVILGQSTPVTTTPPPTTVAPQPPSAPRNVAVDYEAPDDIIVTWDEPSAPRGLTEYQYRYSTNGGDTWSSATDTNSTAGTKRLSGMPPGSYLVEVRAKNAVGTSSWAQSTASVVVPAPPATPTGLEVVGVSTSATATWEASARATSYRVTKDGTQVCQTTVLSCSLSNLNPGTTYTIRVIGVSLAGTSAPSPAVSFTTLGAPESLLVTGVAGDATVTWTAPSGTGGSPITDYDVSWTTDGSTWSSPTATGSTTTSFALSNLNPGTAYTFRVRAVTALGAGSWSQSSAAHTATTTPNAPASVSAKASAEKIVISWAAVAGTAAAPVTGYRVFVDGQQACQVVDTSCESVNRAARTGYSIQVATYGSAGQGPLTPAVVITTMSEPTALAASWATATSASFSWQQPAETGNDSITGYSIEYRPTGSETWFATTASSSPASLTGLTALAEYELRVRAENSVGFSPFETITLAPPQPPSTPVGFNGTASSGKVALAWTEPSSEIPLTGYTITVFDVDGISAPRGYQGEPTIAVQATATTHTVAGLSNGYGYVFTVTATSDAGSSAAATTAPIYLPYTPLASVVGYTANTTPAGWLEANGQAVSRAAYPELFAEVGTTFGSGNGTTTFNLPDLRGRSIVGLDAATPWADTIGKTGGNTSVILSENQMPSHNHTQNAHNHTQNTHNHDQDPHRHNLGIGHANFAISGSNNGLLSGYSYGQGNSFYDYSTGLSTQPIAPTNNATTATNKQATAANRSTGSGAAHNELQPYHTTRWLLSVQPEASIHPGMLVPGVLQNDAGANWVKANGATLSRTTSQELFAAIGTTYGNGDGSTTFRLPNLSGRTLIGSDARNSAFDSLGEEGGSASHTLTTNELPSHTHLQGTHNHTQTSHNHTQNTHLHNLGVGMGSTNVSPGGNTAVSTYGYWTTYSYFTFSNGLNSSATTSTNIATTATNQDTAATSQTAGNSQAHNNLQPYLTTEYYIATSSDALPTPGLFFPSATASAPSSWLELNGSTVSSTSNPALFAAIGTTFGGTTSAFSLPSFKARLAVGQDVSIPAHDTLGETGGVSTVTLTTNEMPSHTHAQDPHTHVQDPHNHTQSAHSHNLGVGNANIAMSCCGNYVVSSYGYNGYGDTWYNQSTGLWSQNVAGTNQATTAANQAATATNQATGGSASHDNLQPYLTLRYLTPASDPAAPLVKPSAPANLTPAIDHNAATVTWSATASTTNAPITGYRLFLDGVQVCQTPTLSCALTGLTVPRSYSFQVASYGPAGQSLLSAAVVAATLNAPSAASATAAGTYATVTWTAPSPTTDITEYVVSVQAPDGSPAAGVTGTLTRNTGATATSYRFTGLSPGNLYSFRVKAKGVFSLSEASGLSAGVQMQSIPTGMLVAYAGTTLPSGWLEANGQSVSRTAYPELFTAVGTTYGNGDGSTTFNLPDLRSRAPVGTDSSQSEFAARGMSGGVTARTLGINEIPSHSHTQGSHNHSQNAHGHNMLTAFGGHYGVTVFGGGTVWANFGFSPTHIWTTNGYGPAWSFVGNTASNNPATGTNQSSGGNAAHNELQPYLTTRWLISMTPREAIAPGMMLPNAAATSPAGWVEANGSTVGRSANPGLFTAVGTTYGTGDGSTTFAIPDARGRTVVGQHTSISQFDVLGETGGTKTHTLTTAEMPGHNHQEDAHNHSQNGHGHIFDGGPGGHTAVTNYAGTAHAMGVFSFAPSHIWTTNGYGATWSAESGTASNNPSSASNSFTGGGAAHNNLQPYRALRWEIATSDATVLQPGLLAPLASGTTPTGWVSLAAATASRSANTSLFNAISTLHGTGDGATTFGLPDMRGRLAVGRDTAQTEFDVIGEIGGAKTHTLTTAEMPSHTHAEDNHNHSQNAHNHGFDAGMGNHYAVTAFSCCGIGAVMGVFSFTPSTVNQSSGYGGIWKAEANTASNNEATITLQPRGGSEAHSNLQPYLTLNYSVFSSEPPAATIPVAPTNVTAVASSTTANVSWSAVANASGYRVLIDGQQACQATTANCTVSNLTAGTTYAVQVVAFNTAGQGPTSTTFSLTAATAPTSVSAAISGSSLNATWTAPTQTGGGLLSGYEIQWSANNGTTWSPSTPLTQGVTTSRTFSDLAMNASYVFRVRATTIAGPTDWSATSPSATIQSSLGVSIQSDAPDGWWRLGETTGTQAADSSGNSRHGTFQNAVLGEAGPLASTKSAYFNGPAAAALSSVVTTTDFGYERTQAFSVEAWVKPAAGAPSGFIAATAPIAAKGWGLFYAGSDAVPYYSYPGPGTLAFHIAADGSNMLHCYTQPGAVTDGRWSHIAASYAGTSLAAGITLYVNGVQHATTCAANTLSASTVSSQPLTIGARPGATPTPFTGNITDVVVTRTALSADRFAHRIVATTDTPKSISDAILTDGPIAYYPMTEATGTASKDVIAGRDVTWAGTHTIGVAGPANDARGVSISGGQGTPSSALPVNTAAGAKNTVSFWFRWDGGNETMPITFLAQNGTTAIALYVCGNGRLSFNTGNGDCYGPSNNALPANQWAHIAAVFQNGTTTAGKLFINGRAVTLSTIQGNPAAGGTAGQTLSGTMRLSGNSVNSFYRLGGTISNVAVFSKELSDTRIAEHFRVGSAVYPAAVLLDGASAYWRMGDTTTAFQDSSGNGSVATATAIPARRAGSYVGATASALDGSTAITTSNAVLNTAPDGFNTVSFLMRWDGTASRMPVSFNTANGGVYDLYMCGAGALAFNTGNSDCYGTPTNTVPVNQWIHVVATFHNGNVYNNTLYLNGVRQTLSRLNASIPSPLNALASFTISGYARDASYRFSGQLSDVAVFPYELSADRALAQFRASGIDTATSYRTTSSAHTAIAHWSTASSDASVWYDRIGRRDLLAAAPRPSSTEGPSGTDAVTFSSSTSSMRVTGIPVSTSANAKHTAQFWMRWNAEPNQSILAFGDGSSGAYGLFSSASCFGFNTGNNDCYGVASNTVPTEEWVLVTAVFNNANVTGSQLYINGVAQTLSQISGTSLNTSVSGKLSVSGWSGDELRKFSGSIAELTLSSGAPDPTWPLAEYTAMMVSPAPTGTLQPPSDVKVSYGAYSTLNFTNISSGLTVAGNGSDDVTVNATSTTGAWNQSVVSNETFTAPASIEFASPRSGSAQYRMIGFTSASGSNIHYTALNYSFYPQGFSGGLAIYESGANPYGGGSYSSTDTMSITYDTDGFMRYRVGSAVVRTVFAGVGMRYRVGVTWHSTSAELANIRLNAGSAQNGSTAPYRVSWSAPLHQSPTGYLVERFSSNGANYSSTPNETYVVGPRASLDIPSLSTNTAHMFKVKSLRGAETSSASAASGLAVYLNGSSTFVTPAEPDVRAEVLVVGGGGGGGGSVNGGGGGAGGVLYHPEMRLSGTYTVSIGAGGNGGVGYYNPGSQFGSNGINSSFGSLTAFGGGGGSGYYHSTQSTADVCRTGGSGGGGQKSHEGAPEGGCSATQTSSNGATGFGNRGGSATQYPSIIAGGGGGGAGGVGGDGSTGFGGDGLPFSITGYQRWYAGGGGGGAYNDYTPQYWTGTGGRGGGGLANRVTYGTFPGHGAPNSGGGGGGTGYNGSTTSRVGGNGGSGIVIVRFDAGTATPTATNNLPIPQDVELTQGVFNPLTFTNFSNGLTVANNGTADVTLGASHTTSGWNQSTISQELLTAPFTLRFRSPAQGGPHYRMFGLTTSSGSNLHYSTLNYSAYPINSTSALEFYELGAYRRSAQATYSTGDWFAISYDTSGFIRYWVGDKLVRTVWHGSGAQFRAAVAWHSSSASIEGIGYAKALWTPNASSPYRISWTRSNDPRVIGYQVEVTSSNGAVVTRRVQANISVLDLELPDNTSHVARVRSITDTGFSQASTGSGLAAYTRVGSHTFTAPAALGSIRYLVVAGGGGGGMDMGGGGGAGGYVADTAGSIAAGSSIVLTVGAGGTGAPAAGTNGQNTAHWYNVSSTNGQNSSIVGAGLSRSAIGGGRGGSSYYDYTPGYQGGAGGSGGGASGYSNGANNVGGGAGTAGQGFSGGNGGGQYYSGGGGGSGGVGAGVRAYPVGGPGVRNDILGPNYWWAGGGGGSGYSDLGGSGGAGGGGGGAIGSSNFGGAGLNYGSTGGIGAINSWANVPGGDAGRNTGGGGGGGSHYNANNKGGEGGSGIVVLRFTVP
jgi:prepilin-type N-terminal cleavage/methylation domain-containing protein